MRLCGRLRACRWAWRRNATEVAQIVANLKPITNPNMSSDLTTAAGPGEGGLRRGLANVEINLGSLKPETAEEQSFTDAVRERVAALMERA